MKERPILFSSSMVRAILDGSKTQTRRVVKPRADRDMGPRCVLRPHELAGEVNGGRYRNSIYGQPGDRLWVRETWNMFEEWEGVFYAADDHSFGIGADDDPGHIPEHAVRWRPSIFMPRWASRILLEITDVRVERLQDISEADAQAEGIEYSVRFEGYCIGMAEHYNSHDPRQSYASLWESINGPDSWAANPWVWVIAFRRIGPRDVPETHFGNMPGDSPCS